MKIIERPTPPQKNIITDYIDEKETIIINLILTEKEQCIITDKKVYANKNIDKNNTKTRIEDLNTIKSIQHIKSKRIPPIKTMLLAIGIILLIIGIISYSEYDGVKNKIQNTIALMFVIGIILIAFGIKSLITYIKTKKDFLLMKCQSSKITINAILLSETEIKEIITKIFNAKYNFNNPQTAQNTANEG